LHELSSFIPCKSLRRSRVSLHSRTSLPHLPPSISHIPPRSFVQDPADQVHPKRMSFCGSGSLGPQTQFAGRNSPTGTRFTARPSQSHLLPFHPTREHFPSESEIQQTRHDTSLYLHREQPAASIVTFWQPLDFVTLPRLYMRVLVQWPADSLSLPKQPLPCGYVGSVADEPGLAH
jgi:hypothetical protein